MNKQANANAISNYHSVFFQHMEFMGESDFELSEWSWDNGTKEFNQADLRGEFRSAGRMFMVLSEADREEKALNYIRESLWAFLPAWIADWMERNGKLRNGESVEHVTEMLKASAELYEGGNAIRERLIEDVEKFAKDACDEDGHAHFLSTYDDKEYEYEAPDGSLFYVYRTN
tara:strand:+ start:315 stop:833 length:519 start_codon:yes stop_codon:yes gene_type:complete